MLESTFCHIPQISLRSEARIWKSGVLRWQDVGASSPWPLRHVLADFVARYVEESYRHLHIGDPHHFADALPPILHWRLFPEYRHTTAYLDIETTGLAPPHDKITTIALYDGREIRTYVAGQNLDRFVRDICDYKVLVTYNGKCFDVPFIEKTLGGRLGQVHLDLRYILRSLGYRGGLKGCEKQLGVVRPGLEDVDGYFAVLLWQEYTHRKNDRALETLLCYNIHDVVNLETLLVKAYNLHIKESPFASSHTLAFPAQPAVSFQAHADVIEALRPRWMR